MSFPSRSYAGRCQFVHVGGSEKKESLSLPPSSCHAHISRPRDTIPEQSFRNADTLLCQASLIVEMNARDDVFETFLVKRTAYHHQ